MFIILILIVEMALLCTLGFEVLRWVGAVGWGGLLGLRVNP